MDTIDDISNKAYSIITWLTEHGVNYGMRLLGAIIVLIIGLWVIRFISNRFGVILDKSDITPALRSFVKSMASVLLKIILFISVLGMVGIEMTTFIAMLTAASLAVAMAFNGTLSNFAGGVMILFFKPFKIGDFINAQGYSGTVKEILIFVTILTTPDNKTIIIPNGPLSNGSLTNYSTQDSRRIEWTFGIGYGDNYDVARDMIMGFIKEDNRILNDPAEPFIVLGELADSSVNLTVRVWVKPADYWGVYFSMNEKFYKNADKHNINIPFPQMDVHVNQVK
ncbi:MAG: mechanosensitive ion channel [Lentimicrobiaceae bacterium]|jgi:small conductance mechanosensitive channel|nr:mechanosensitive ion channel [Lentimicrobiaceae bacterium]MBT3453692.1 mechanosensitive ion channel [Lentimicrobiaceae bacterium]MBT3818223.1 mechanosensitive ion channel [Lentimicrobiaceae bacterium]MBT4061769.1 mechanosensitive ion channel [Lentimicrobiaceae bacterium]MBT4190947.1 mechanosensitive ion channel [Lentimicrobiaceae bacterium]